MNPIAALPALPAIAAILTIPMLIDVPALREKRASFDIVLAQAGGGETNPQFDQGRWNRVRKQRPEIVLIGNSMLRTRIDEEELRRLSGKRITILAKGGSATAAWYLLLKNFALAHPAKPRNVIFFFRDDVLTDPRRSLDGGHRQSVVETMRGAEPEMREVLQGSDTWRDRARLAVQRLYPLIQDRPYIRKRIEIPLRDVATGTGSKRPFEQAIASYFGLANIRLDVPDGLASHRRSDTVAFRPENTFLPRILDLAEANDLNVVFYRVKRRPCTLYQPAYRKALDDYMERLRHYLAERGATLADVSDSPEITLGYYADGDHIAENHMRPYTKFFYRQTGPLLR